MNEKEIVGAVMAAVFVILGFLLSTNEKVARWGLTHGRGQIWARMLGMERALKVTKWFFGPVLIVLGALAMLATVFATKG